MNVTFIHYHLKPGGVTTVIADQVSALKNIGGRALVLTGEGNQASFPTEAITVEGLGYDDTDGSKYSPNTVANAVQGAIKRHFTGKCHLIHIHNPTLAKNKQFLNILKALQNKGITLFLQIHDFAEDGRADAFFQGPYPANCHYGVINRRDFNILLRAGLKKEGVHYLPNAVSPLAAFANGSSNNETGNKKVVYPIRAIRRKNIGEAILLSLFFPDDTPLAITLPPNSESDQLAYEGWKSFTAYQHMPVQFEVGLTHDFREVISAAAFIITTSITEGFGFTFLEPWTADKLIWGRKLDKICGGFEERGVDLSHLYTELHIPMNWIDKKEYIRKWRNAVHDAAECFEWFIDETNLSKVELHLLNQETIDFGLLNEKFQKQVIQQLIADPIKRKQLVSLNPFLSNILLHIADKRLIDHNKNAILQEFSRQRYQQRLIDTYKKVSSTPVIQSVRKEVLLSHFFNLEEFSLLKWAAYED